MWVKLCWRGLRPEGHVLNQWVNKGLSFQIWGSLALTAVSSCPSSPLAVTSGQAAVPAHPRPSHQ